MVMAYTAHGTLVANVVSSVTVDVRAAGVEVINRSLTGEIYVRFDGPSPAVAGADSYVVLGSRIFEPRIRGAVTVKLISSGPLLYSVEAA